MPSAVARIEAAVPPERFLAVILDFERYAEFLPQIERARVIREEPDAWEVRFQLHFIRPVSYVLRLERDGPLGVRWSLVEGLFRVNEGSWRLEPLDGGARTRATYRITIQLDAYLPGSLVRSLVERDLPELLERFRARAESLQD